MAVALDQPASAGTNGRGGALAAVTANTAARPEVKTAGSVFWKSAIQVPPAFGQPCVVVGMYVAYDEMQ
jgi:hypothetical protein